MKLSKFLSVALLGAVAFTSQAMAAGTVAGTEIKNQPTLNYSMGDAAKTADVEATSYLVDKVINFTLARVDAKEQTIIAGKTGMAAFKLSNIGNSVENFALSNDGWTHEFDFSSKKFYVDADNSGSLEESEKIDTKLVSKLAIDGSTTVWMEVAVDEKVELSKANWEGVMAQAVDASANPYVASTTNDLAVEDVVFADSSYGAASDAERDGKLALHNKWTTIENPDNVKLTVAPITSEPAVKVTYDPTNGTENPMMIPGAKVVKRWSIKNETSTTATDVKFSVAIDSETEYFAKDLSATWMAGRSQPTQFIWNNTTRTATDIEGVIDGDVITYTIPEIKAGEEMIPHLILRVK
ncbi:MAG: hypothetical protein K0U38_04120 [Epsilonproteobacteria bacterium]|nr:hypothetical protein [Campylobacterota bacterium]